jgi:hypothetical protein
MYFVLEVVRKSSSVELALFGITLADWLGLNARDSRLKAFDMASEGVRLNGTGDLLVHV